ncbi:DASH family cryptochrome [Alteromonas halophila]|uniref:Cryptochrome DASH n=1 Tax=Alteromonas halophila TaxID=516698 RepID=A0A918MYK6_9ALTE|nr:DASH family cryptochrome [Alteromonas halophila]GGW88564.1 cryptochrome DASH [Alteromonas halophila]
MAVQSPCELNRGLFWFRHDLRLHDNPALRSLADKVSTLSCIFIIDPAWFETNGYGLKAMGSHRYNFLMQSLADLDKHLRQKGQQLQILWGQPRDVIKELVHTHDIDAMGVTPHCGEYEQADETWLHEKYAHLSLFAAQSTTLYNQNALPFALDNMPSVYTPFRKKVENSISVEPAVSAPATLPDLYHLESHYSLPTLHAQARPLGGELAGIDHLNQYFSSDRPATYKETRNTMDKWNDSTRFSPWLANGALSARRVFAEVEQYEASVKENTSTYWIKFELLWREFFHWQAKFHRSAWFSFGGIQQSLPDTHHDPDTFKQWCQGETGYDIVDACMRQLNLTGYMSNRGRQLVASCFVHELAQDWRYGAAYFEQQLIDFDVASNWGNWLYLAGVGSDPRGHRQFNLESQADRYDADGQFRQTWLQR